MPLRQYRILKRAVDLESIYERRLRVYDTNRAFHDAKPLFEQLEKDYMTLLHGSDKKAGSASVNWGKDPNAAKKLRAYQK